MSNKNGIAVVGTILVDRLCEIDAYPKAGQLTQIKRLSFSVGGLVPNVAIDLKILDPKLSVSALGKVGDDFEGKFAVEKMRSFGVDCSDIIVSSDEKTGFSDAMSVVGGQRTFFTYSGANASFGVSDIPWERLSYKMLHLGYFLLMDTIDKGDGLTILKKAKQAGMSTSIDLVSENSDRYKSVVPCLKFVDNLIINETEAGNLCGIAPSRENLPDIAEKLLNAGVNERVIIHMPECAVCLSKDKLCVLPSYDLPEGWIKGTTGAGDAFCSGALTGIYYGKDDKTILDYAQVAAASSLKETDATSGIFELSELKKTIKRT